MEKLSQLTPITRLLDGIGQIGMSSSTYYDKTNPNSARYDPEVPTPFKIGRSSFLVMEELERFIQKQIATRAKACSAVKAEVTHGK